MNEDPAKKFWKIRIEDDEGRNSTFNVDANLVRLCSPEERDYLLREAGEAIDVVLHAREHAKKLELQRTAWREVEGY